MRDHARRPAVGVVVVAGGRGRRLGGLPKQYRHLGDRPLLAWSVDSCQKSREVDDVVLVVPPGDETRVGRWVISRGWSKVCAVVAGGASRGGSVRNGFRRVPDRCEVVLVHDAARPGVTSAIIGRVAQAARRSGAAVAAWPVADTLKRSSPKGGRWWVQETVPRDGLWQAQTPQGFRRNIAQEIFSVPHDIADTDDVQALERQGRKVELVLGSPQNFKITGPEDLLMSRRLLRMVDRR